MNDEQFAEVSTVPAQYRGRILTGMATATAVICFILQILLALVVGAMPLLLMVVFADDLFGDVKDKGPIAEGSGIVMSALLYWLFVGQIRSNSGYTWYMFHRTQGELSRRPDVLFDPHEPAALLVEVIPQQNWGATNSASDQGLILVDDKKRQILFEGDNKRYRVPFSAVTGCVIELLDENEYKSQRRAAPLALVLLSFRERGGGESPREIPFRPMRQVSCAFIGEGYKQKAESLHSLISNAIGSGMS